MSLLYQAVQIHRRYSCLKTYRIDLWVSLETHVNKIKMPSTYWSDLKTQSQILHFRNKLLLQLMNLELRKERKEKKGTPRKEHFILLLL